MSVIIKGMKMPKCCAECEFHLTEDISFEIMHQCEIKTGYIDECDIHGFPYDCPLVEIPEKHGDLIDRDWLMDGWMDLRNATKYGNKTAEQQRHSYSTLMMYEIADAVDDAPTIFEAE